MQRSTDDRHVRRERGSSDVSELSLISRIDSVNSFFSRNEASKKNERGKIGVTKPNRLSALKNRILGFRSLRKCDAATVSNSKNAADTADYMRADAIYLKDILDDSTLEGSSDDGSTDSSTARQKLLAADRHNLGSQSYGVQKKENSMHIENKSQAIVPSIESNESNCSALQGNRKMVDDLRTLLTKWDIPESQWNLPQGMDGIDEDSVMNKSTPLENKKLIDGIRTAFAQDEERSRNISDRIDQLSKEAKRALEELQDTVSKVENKVGSVHSNTTTKEKLIKRTMQNYKESMESEVRTKLNQQVESREHHIHNLIKTIRNQVDELYIDMESNGVVQRLLHIILQFAIWFVGMLAHFFALGWGLASYPFWLIHAVASGKKGS